jgi:hypothetical protein
MTVIAGVSLLNGVMLLSGRLHARGSTSEPIQRD